MESLFMLYLIVKVMNFFPLQITHIAPVILVHTSESLEFPFDNLLSKM